MREGEWSGECMGGGVNIHHRYAANTWAHTPAQLPVCVYYDLTLSVYAGLAHTLYPPPLPLPPSAIYLSMYCCLCWSIVFTCGFHTHTHTHSRNWYLPKHNNKINHNLSAPLAGVIYAPLNLPYIHKLLFWLSFICSYIFFIYFIYFLILINYNTN